LTYLPTTHHLLWGTTHSGSYYFWLTHTLLHDDVTHCHTHFYALHTTTTDFTQPTTHGRSPHDYTTPPTTVTAPHAHLFTAYTDDTLGTHDGHTVTLHLTTLVLGHPLDRTATSWATHGLPSPFLGAFDGWVGPDFTF